MDAATSILLQTPLLVPAAGLGAAFLLFALFGIVAWFLVQVLYPPFGEIVGSADGGGINFVLMIWYNPGLAQLTSAISFLTSSITAAFEAFQDLLGADVTRIIIAVIGALVAGVFLALHNTILLEVNTFAMCYLDPLLRLVKQLANAARLIFGIAWPMVTAITGFQWSILGVLQRVVRSCALDTGVAVIEDLLAKLFEIARALIEGLASLFNGGDLLTGRFDFVPLFSRVGELAAILSLVLDCACLYLSFVWTEVFELPQDPAFALTLDCAVNTALRVIQALLTAVVNLETPQIADITTELICVVTSGGDFAEAAVLAVTNIFTNFINLIPLYAALQVEMMAETPLLSIVASSNTDVPTFAHVVLAMHQYDRVGALDRAAAAAAPTFHGATGSGFHASNVSNLSTPTILLPLLSDLLGIGILLDFLETPWSRSITEPAAGILHAVNATWSLTLLPTRACLCYNDIAFFQVGYIFDRFRNTAYVFGEMVSIFDPKLYYVVADTMLIVVNIVNIVVELMVAFIFENAYNFAVDGNPFEYLVDYCLSNATLGTVNYHLYLNHSAEIAILFGCDPAGDLPYPLSSQAAKCADNVLACFAMNAYRFVIELQEVILKFGCYLSHLVQFRNDKVMFDEINVDGVFRPLLHLAECIRQLWYLFDVVSLGFPADVTCEYLDVSDTVSYKKAFACALGNLSKAAATAFISLYYELIILIRSLLASFVTGPLPLPVTKVVIPTFSDAVRNLDVVLCELGALVGSIFPVSFSCNAQATGTGTLNQLYVGPPPIQDQAFFPVVPLVNRTYQTCTWRRDQWAATFNASACNCSAVQWGAAYTGHPACFLSCTDFTSPALPFKVGVTQFPGICQDLGVETSTTFTNLSMLTAYLARTDPILEANVQRLTDVIDGSHPAGEFMGELTTALINDYFHRLYNPNTHIVYGPHPDNQSACANLTGAQLPLCDEDLNITANCTNSTTDVDMDAFAVRLTDNIDAFNIPMATILDIIGRFFYGGAARLIASNPPNNEPMQTLLSCFYQAGPSNTENVLGSIIGSSGMPKPFFSLPGWTGIGWNHTARVLTTFLRKYNDAFGRCGTPAFQTVNSVCFKEVTRADAPDVPPAPLATALTDATPLLVTFTPENLANATAGACNCTNPERYYQTPTPDSGRCLLECDRPVHTWIVGARTEQCLIPYACLNRAMEINLQNAAQLDALLLDGQTTSATGPRLHIPTDGSGGSVDILNASAPTPPRAFTGKMLAAKMNIYYAKRYFPQRITFLRRTNDPLFSRECVANDDDRILWGGQRIDNIVDVLDRVYFGDHAPRNIDCNGHYRYNSAAWKLCRRTVMRFTQLVGAAWGTQTGASVYPLLNAYNAHRRADNVSAQNECFIEAMFDTEDALAPLVVVNGTFIPGVGDLPALELTTEQFYSLTDTPVADLEPCEATIACGERIFCTTFRMVVIPFQIVSSVLEQIRAAILGTAGEWTMGFSFFEMIKLVLSLLWARFSSFWLNAMTALDCIICAIGGNVPGSGACASSLFVFFKPLVVALYDLGALFIGTAVDIIEAVVNIVVYFFTADFEKLGETIIGLFETVFVELIGGIFNIIGGLIVKNICLCPTWNFLFGNDTFTCANGAHCDNPGATAKRSIMGESRTLMHAYEIFAPDWPTRAYRYEWPAAHPCHDRMAALAPRAPNLLTPAEVDEAGYCLALATLFNQTTTGGRDHSTHFVDACDVLMHELWAAQTGYAQLTHADRAKALQCISEWGIVAGFKADAYDRQLDWVPANILTISANPLASWLPLLGVLQQASAARRERARDNTYSTVILESPEYRANAARIFGRGRADLTAETLLARRNPGRAAPPVDAYANALARDGSSARQKQAVASMARMLERLDTTGRADLLDMLDQETDRRVATLPPTYEVVREDDGTVSTTETTRKMLLDTSEEATGRPLDTVLGRLTHSSVKLLRLVYHTGRGHVERETKRRALQQAEAPGSTPSSILDRFFRGLGDGLNVTRELWDGRAHDNATAEADAEDAAMSHTAAHVVGPQRRPTTVRWQLTSRVMKQRELQLGTRAPSAAARAHKPLDPWIAFAGPVGLRWGVQQAAFGSVRASLSYVGANYGASAARTQRLEEVSKLVARVRELVSRDSISMRAAFNASVPFDPSICLVDETICRECLIIDQYVGYWVQSAILTGEFYLSLSPYPYNNFNALYDDYLATAAYLANPLSTVKVGDSPDLPVRLFAPDVNMLRYLGDPITTKIRFSDMQPLIDRTIAFFNDLVGNAPALGEDPYAAVGMTAQMARTRNLPLPIDGQFMVHTLAVRELSWIAGAAGVGRGNNGTTVRASGDAFRAAAISDLGPLLIDWVNYFNRALFTCNRLEEYDGSNVRFSLGEALAIMLVPVTILLLASLASPTVGSVVFSFTGQMGLVLGALLVLALASGWSVSCLPGLPPVFFTVQAMHFVTQVWLPSCPVVTAGLVNEVYTNDNCMLCALWQDYFTMPNCISDLGWYSPLDVPVFFLKQYAPDTLVLLQDPTNYPPPFDLLVSTSAVQSFLRRWDDVDLTTDHVARSQNWSCFFITIVPWFLILFFLFVIAKIGPGFALFKALAGLIQLILSSAGAFLIATVGLVIGMGTMPLLLVLASRKRVALLRETQESIDADLAEYDQLAALQAKVATMGARRF